LADGAAPRTPLRELNYSVTQTLDFEERDKKREKEKGEMKKK